MPGSDSHSRRAVALSSVAVGLTLLGASASGVAALRSDLETAARPAVRHHLADDAGDGRRDGDCPLAPVRTPAPEV